MNEGKKFEADFDNSMPEYVKSLRLSDPPQAFNQNQGLRFSKKNPFDYLLWDSKRHILYAIENKTVAGKSISFERTKEDKGEIHYHQIEGLNDWNKYDGTVCGFIIFFRQIETTIFLDIDSFNKLSNAIDKKSFNLSDLDNLGLPYYVIPQQKKITRYKYEMDTFFSTIHINNGLIIGGQNEE